MVRAGASLWIVCLGVLEHVVAILDSFSSGISGVVQLLDLNHHLETEQKSRASFGLASYYKRLYNDSGKKRIYKLRVQSRASAV